MPSFPAPALLLVSPNKPYFIMSAPHNVSDVVVPLCMTMYNTSIMKFKISLHGLAKVSTRNSNFKNGEQWLAVGASIPSPCPQGYKVSIIEMLLMAPLPLLAPAQPLVPMPCVRNASAGWH